ncbi:MAG: hypothetical protein V3W44_00750 [Dehalococcoidales bacterium]
MNKRSKAEAADSETSSMSRQSTPSLNTPKATPEHEGEDPAGRTFEAGAADTSEDSIPSLASESMIGRMRAQSAQGSGIVEIQDEEEEEEEEEQERVIMGPPPSRENTPAPREPAEPAESETSVSCNSVNEKVSLHLKVCFRYLADMSEIIARFKRAQYERICA